ncbi:MAG: RsmE family RNA methyltransferase [Candidatus Omnitrophica bacterium]|nr:RsmE family RNA methyltransferase [Candidatus Omnitrophota bacterium]
MRRFFCQSQNITSQGIKILDKEELHHLRNVLRLKNKDKILVIDGKGKEFVCEVGQLDKDEAQLNIIEERHHEKDEVSVVLTIACALPKKSKIDFIVEKLTEIGVERIILLKTERTEVIWKDCNDKLERLKRIASASLKQSGNLFMPEIIFLDFKGLLEFKNKNAFDLALIANLSNNTQYIKGVLENNCAKNILAAIGPEGDFSEKEIELANKAGFISIRLTDTVLKVDTAAISTAAFIKLYTKQ